MPLVLSADSLTMARWWVDALYAIHQDCKEYTRARAGMSLGKGMVISYPSLVYQGNMSAILLETNGKVSSTKQTKHIKVKYFYVRDKID